MRYDRHGWRDRGGDPPQRKPLPWGPDQARSPDRSGSDRRTTALRAHQNENALFGFDSVPFLATSFDDADKLWEAAKPTIEKTLADQGLHLLYAVPWPPQGLYFRDAVNSVADMKGIKFRSYNNATTRLAELTGMLPVTIEAAEISQGLCNRRG